MSDRHPPWPPDDDDPGPWEGYGSLDEGPDQPAPVPAQPGGRPRRRPTVSPGPEGGEWDPTEPPQPGRPASGSLGRSTQPIHDPAELRRPGGRPGGALPAPPPGHRSPDDLPLTAPERPADRFGFDQPTAPADRFGFDQPTAPADRFGFDQPTAPATAPGPGRADDDRYDPAPFGDQPPGADWVDEPTAFAPDARPEPGRGADATVVGFEPESPLGGYDRPGRPGDGGGGAGLFDDDPYPDAGYPDPGTGYADGYDHGYDDVGDGYAHGDPYGDPYGDDRPLGPGSTLADDDLPYQATAGAEPEGRRGRREARLRQRALQREARWERNRFAVPYRTDGPKLTLGVLWFVAIVGAIVVSPLLTLLVVGGVAALAGLQVGYAWFPRHGPTRTWTAAGAGAAAVAGILGPLGGLVAFGIGMAVALAYGTVNESRSRSTLDLIDVGSRAIVPVGVAAASLVALATISPWPTLVLVVLVSAYEVGDFLVGSGASNPIEGPISGLVAMATIVFVLWVVTPPPFSSDSIILFGALAGVCCPLGQLFASLILPRGSAWAPALRRLDSYLVITPLWMVLVAALPTGALGSG